jgi:hypothetical protein
MRAAILARIRGDAAPAGSSKWAKTKRYRTRTQSRLQLSKDHRSAQQRLRACGNREGRVVKDPHIIWSWSKPGIFFLAGAPAKSRQGCRGLCGGPGIPNGAVGDYGWGGAGRVSWGQVKVGYKGQRARSGGCLYCGGCNLVFLLRLMGFISKANTTRFQKKKVVFTRK